MKIEVTKPFARGVQELQYVGDVPAPPSVKVAGPEDYLPIAALALVAWKTKGATRLASAAGAAYLAFRHLSLSVA